MIRPEPVMRPTYMGVCPSFIVSVRIGEWGDPRSAHILDTLLQRLLVADVGIRVNDILIQYALGLIGQQHCKVALVLGVVCEGAEE